MIIDNIVQYLFYRSGELFKRQRGGDRVLCRLPQVPPKQQDRYHLRMLLTVQRGFTSYEDIRTVNGAVYDTFKEACQALNLLDNDEAHSLCLTEASVGRRPYAMRRLIAYQVFII